MRASDGGSFHRSIPARTPHATTSTSSSRPTNPDFSGLWIPLVTPFPRRRGRPCRPRRADPRLADQGVTGFVVCGSTGEAAALDEAETTRRARHRAGRGAGAAAHHGRLGLLTWASDGLAAQVSREAPLAGLLVPAPNYVRPSQAGLIDWFTRHRRCQPGAGAVYDIPYRTGVTIARETLLTLAAHRNIRAIKDCGGDTAKTRALIADGRLQVLAAKTRRSSRRWPKAASAPSPRARNCRPNASSAGARCGQPHGRSARRMARRWYRDRDAVRRAEPRPAKGSAGDQGEMRDVLRSPMTRASDCDARAPWRWARLSRP